MKEIKSITVFSGVNYYTLDNSNYEKIMDETIEYENSIHIMICCYKDSKTVRTLWNISCDITYK